MNKKLSTIIRTKFASNQDARPILTGTHVVANGETIVTEATDSHIAIRHTEGNSLGLNFETLQGQNGKYMSPEAYPNLSRLFEAHNDSNKQEITAEKLNEFIAAAITNKALKTERFGFELVDLNFCFSTKFANVIADTLKILLDPKISAQNLKISVTSSISPLCISMESVLGKTEILICPIRSK